MLNFDGPFWGECKLKTVLVVIYGKRSVDLETVFHKGHFFASLTIVSKGFIANIIVALFKNFL